jgi:hypothetical protein
MTLHGRSLRTRTGNSSSIDPRSHWEQGNPTCMTQGINFWRFLQEFGTLSFRRSLVSA